MQFETLSELVFTGMRILRGKILALNNSGEIEVQCEADDTILLCYFLRTSAAPLPEFHPGDTVLLVSDENGESGYVLGVVQPYLPVREISQDNGHLANGNEPLPEIKLNASERIELRCGQSSLTMNKEGTVIVKGAKVVSRSSGVNKIKGATVQIN